MQLVPFDPEWVMSDKLDLHAIYRRPNGDLTTALPVRRHLDWLKKGFEWVTLADADSLMAVAGSLRSKGLSPAAFVADVQTNSPWSYAAYVRAGYAPAPPVVEAPAASAPPAPKAPVVRRKKRGRPKRQGPSPLAVSLGEPQA